MIKCNVTVCGTISRTAQMRTGKEGKPFMSLGINVVIPAKSGINKTVEISVAKDGGSQEELANYPVGNRVEVVGTLTFHKKGEAFYLNLSATGINTFSAGSEDSIKGDIEFRGTLGNKIEEKKDKKGNPFCVFSAFSSEKNGENYDYTWIRFLQFGESRKDWMCSPRLASMPRVNSRCLSITTVLTLLAVSVRCLSGTRQLTILTPKAYA